MMKDYFWIMLIVTTLIFSGCGSKGTAQNVETTEEINTTIKFTATEQDLGHVLEGEKVVARFEIENTGDANLFIHQVRASCGCTSPKFDQSPIRPGRKSIIEVTFDTRGRPGNQRQTLVVVANTEPASTNLVFTCEVVTPMRRQ